MTKALIMIHVNITGFVLISQLEKDSMIEMYHLKNVIFFQTISSFGLSRILALLNNDFLLKPW